jgi:predicted amidohydrolase
MRLAATQFFATPFDRHHNLQTAERLIRSAVAYGAKVVVLPELFNTGYVFSRQSFAAAEPTNGETLRWMGTLSAQLKTHIAGSLLLRDDDRVFNAFVLVGPDGKAHRYLKQHPFLWERCYFEPGRGPTIVETEIGRIGLMVCWDIAHRRVWESYRGKVDMILVASSPPRFHRAVLNFPEGRKIYLAEMMPALLAQREAIDRWYAEDLAARATWLGVPVVHSVMAGRFVAEIPFPRLSFFGGAITQPKLWRWAAQAHRASLRATFYGTSAVFDSHGMLQARVEVEEGIAVAEATPPSGGGPEPKGFNVPLQMRVLEMLLRPVAANYYSRNRRG